MLNMRRLMASQQSPLRIVQGWALYPLVLQKKYKVTLQKTPHPPTHSCRLNYPSPALVHLSNPPRQPADRVCVDTSKKLASSSLPLLFEVARVLFFWYSEHLCFDDSTGLNNHNPPKLMGLTICN